ncbi:GIP [Symbiodinium sp. KB8]|nr:GIP [Symbiodinium sp. KB8]
MRADAVLQFFQSPPLVGWNTMWNVVTCCSQRTLWSKIEVCCRQAGFIVGPVCYAALAFVVRHNRDVSPISMMGWSFVGLTLFQAAAASLCLPTVVDPSAKEEEAEDVPAARTNMQEVELNPEELPPETRRRRQIVWNIFVYCSERTFTVGAIEVSTMMLLEVEYGWQTELCGASFMAVGGSSIVATKTFWTGEDKLFMEMGKPFLALVSLHIRFPFLASFYCSIRSSLGPSELLAETLVYASLSVSNGIAQGFATSAVMKGTSFDIQSYRLQSLASIQTSRFVVLIFTRFILDFSCRNLYALVQSAPYVRAPSGA